MRKLFIIALLVMASLPMFSQNSVKSIIAKIDSSRLSFDYGYTIHKKINIVGDGQITIQGNCFKLLGNGLEVFCDGKTKWSLDKSSKELLIENIEADENYDIESNPTLMISSINKVFNIGKIQKVKYKGHIVDLVNLIPKVKRRFNSVNLYVVGNKIIALKLILDDGTKMDIEINNFRYLPISSIKDFEFNISNINKRGWVITDLR